MSPHAQVNLGDGVNTKAARDINQEGNLDAVGIGKSDLLEHFTTTGRLPSQWLANFTLNFMGYS